MTWLDVAGGIGQGVSEGTKDIRDMRNAELQQQLARQQIALNKPKLSEAQDTETARQQIKGLKRPGQTYDGPDTGEPGVPPKQLTQTESGHAKQSAGIYRGLGLTKQANEESDRAQQQQIQEYTNKAMDLIRKSNTMPLDQYANEAANLKNGDDTHVNATTYKDPATGQLHGLVYHGGSGEAARVPIKGHQDVTDMLMGSIDPERYMASRRLKQGDTQAEAQKTTAEASAKQAQTTWDRLLAEKGAGLFTAQAGEMRARANQANAEAGLAPAKAAELYERAGYEKSHGELAKAQGEKFRQQANSFEEKLPEHQKMYLNQLKGTIDKLTTASANDPKNQALQVQLQRSQYEVFKAYRDFGMDGIDPYGLSGVPQPDKVAKDMAKLKPDKQEEYLAKAEAAYGRSYANDVRAAMPAAKPTLTNGIKVHQPPVMVNRPNAQGITYPGGKYTPIEEQ